MCGEKIILPDEEITLDDLLDDEAGDAAPPATLRELIARGFPLHCGVEGLAVIEQLGDPGPDLAPVHREYLRLLEIQRRHSGSK